MLEIIYRSNKTNTYIQQQLPLTPLPPLYPLVCLFLRSRSFVGRSWCDGEAVALFARLSHRCNNFSITPPDWRGGRCDGEVVPLNAPSQVVPFGFLPRRVFRESSRLEMSFPNGLMRGMPILQSGSFSMRVAIALRFSQRPFSDVLLEDSLLELGPLVIRDDGLMSLPDAKLIVEEGDCGAHYFGIDFALAAHKG